MSAKNILERIQIKEQNKNKTKRNINIKSIYIYKPIKLNINYVY